MSRPRKDQNRRRTRFETRLETRLRDTKRELATLRKATENQYGFRPSPETHAQFMKKLARFTHHAIETSIRYGQAACPQCGAIPPDQIENAFQRLANPYRSE